VSSNSIETPFLFLASLGIDRNLCQKTPVLLFGGHSMNDKRKPRSFFQIQNSASSHDTKTPARPPCDRHWFSSLRIMKYVTKTISRQEKKLLQARAATSNTKTITKGEERRRNKCSKVGTSPVGQPGVIKQCCYATSPRW
jgi:hypothetical protein